MDKREKAEERIQQECYMWFHNTYPEYRGLLNYNLNNSKNAIDGVKNKAIGLQPGRADMELLFEGRAYFIELKTAKGKQSKKQIEWEGVVRSHGFEYYIVRSLNEFRGVVESIIK